MSADRRILALAGLLNEEMSLSNAYDLLRSGGVNTVNLDDEAMRRGLRGKNADDAQTMKAAYDFIKANAPEEPKKRDARMKWEPVSQNRGGTAPPWAEGLSDWTIRKEDLTDANFVRKMIWEISGRPTKNPVSLWVWDGERFGQHLVVLGKASKFKEMAKAMVALSRNNAKAVFMNGNSNKMFLLYLDGRYLDQPKVFEKKSTGRNPNNDWDFVARLPRELAQITSKFETEADHVAGDYKAWVNIESNKVYSFSVEKNYYDAIRTNPKLFGTFADRTTLKARIAIERAGWVAVGVNSSEEGAAAIVTALTAQHALKASRMLFRLRYQKGDWNSLKVKTNDEDFTLTGRSQIRDYLMTGKKPGGAEDREVHIDA